MLLTYKENVHSTQMYIPLKPLFSRHKGIGVQFSDEPTGALDKKTGQQIMELLLQIVRENNIMLLLVTHDSDIANTCDTIFEMDEGRLRCAKNDF